jgi:hypothetical protein
MGGFTVPLEHQADIAYYSVIIPWSDNPTQWHPTDKGFSPLSRGAFTEEAKAHDWAKDNLEGQPYTVKPYYHD